MRVLFLIHGANDPRAAVFRNVGQRAEYLRQRGHEVDVISRSDLPFRRLARIDPLILPLVVAARRFAAYDVLVFHSYLGWVFHVMRRWLNRSDAAVTITEFHGLEPIYFRALERELAAAGIPISRRFRLMNLVILPQLLRLTCRRSDGVLCLNTSEAEYLQSHGWAEASRVSIVGNGVEPGLLQPRVHRKRPTRLLYVGQWLPAKGTRHLARAFGVLALEDDALQLACVGTRSAAARVLEAFPAAVRARVTVRPEVDRGELADELRRADVFVFPSLSEGSSSALLEAMAAGLPIVATEAGAACDLLEHEASALLVPPGDDAPLVDSLRRMLGDAALRTRLGAAAQARAASCTWDVVNATYEHVLLAALHRRRSAAMRLADIDTHDPA